MNNDGLLNLTIAGVAASLAETAVLYPLEYLKTREQIAIKLDAKGKVFVPKITSVFYRGVTAFATGNALKAVIRYSAFDQITRAFAGEDRRAATAPQMILAGLATGIAETAVVLPFENIKTILIEASSLGKGAHLNALPATGSVEAESIFHNAQAAQAARQKESMSHSATPSEVKPDCTAAKGKRVIRPAARYDAGRTTNNFYPVREIRGMFSAISYMYEQRGLRAFVQGFNPTWIRQVANSSVRFTSYTFFRQLLYPQADSKAMSLSSVILLSGLTSLVEATLTQPIDVIKSRMQTANASVLYNNSLRCSFLTFKYEGISRLWAGLLPRFLRIWGSGALIFMVFEQTREWLPTSERPLM